MAEKAKKKKKNAINPDGGPETSPPPIKNGSDYENKLRSKVLEDIDAEPEKLDTKYQDELSALKDEAAQYKDGKLPTLDEETSGEFDEMLAAQKGELDMARKDAQEDWLLRAYGSGGQRSTVAGEAAGRMLYGLEQTHRQLLSDDAQRRLNARADQADRIMQNLGFRAEITGQQAQIALEEFGIRSQERTADKNRRASLLDSVYNRHSAEKIAKIDADARVRSSRITAAATVKSAEYGYRGDLAHASAARYASELGYEASIFGDRKRFRSQQLDRRQQARQFNTELDFRKVVHGDEMALEREKLQYQDKWNREANSAAMKQAIIGAVGSGLSMAAMASDVRLKTEIVRLPHALEDLQQIKGYQWKWLGSDSAIEAGVLAQEVEKIIPTAVHDTPEGYKMVSYTAVIGLLVNAVQELAEQVKDLQNAVS